MAVLVFVCLFFGLLVVALPTSAATPGLLAGYAFNEGSGNSAADASGNGLTGVLTNGAGWSTGRNGGAVQLDGVNDYVDVGNPAQLQLTGSMTASAWIYASAFPFDDAAIISKRDGGDTGWQLDTTIDTGPRRIGFKLTNSSGAGMFRFGATTLQTNTWYHVAGVYDAATNSLNVYLNGQLDNGQQTGTITATQRDAPVGVTIGHRPSWWSSEFIGRIDDARVYGRALSPTEIQTDMNTPVVPPPADANPPTVAITAPTAGATVSGTVSVTATASDDVGVQGVQFLLDGANLGSEDTTPPYEVTWNTASSPNGSHALTARARDGANTTTSNPVNLVVSNVGSGGGPSVVAGYPFDEGSGTSAADVSGNGLTGTLTNGAGWAVGRHGGAVQLGAGADFVNLGNPTALRLTGSMTASAWIYSTAFPFDDAAIISKRSNGEIGWQLDTTIDTGPRRIGFKLTNGLGGGMFRFGATTLQPDTWYHVAGVYNATTNSLEVYLNGQLDNGPLNGTVTSSQQDAAVNVNIGRRPANWSSEFIGRIDDARVYDRALTQAEIQNDMNKPLGGASPSDPTPPTVSITAPTPNAQLSDIVNLTASAADNVAVTAVQFLVDGVNIGAEDTDPPYGLAWDTRTTTNGAHVLTARARDAAGNSTLSTPIPVNVTNANFFQNEVLATGFSLPTSIEFLPDGRMLVVELAGTIKVMSPPYNSASPTPFLQITNIGSAGVQQGIYDVALDPQFATTRFYYVSYTAGSPNRDRVSRFTANASLTGTVAGSELVLYQDPQNADAEHHGGALNFANDGRLLFTTGEHFQANEAQLLTNPRGKVHRINTDGTIPTDNPFHDGTGPNVDSIWALGLRNPFRAYYDAPTDRLFIGDVGGNNNATAREEVNLGARGANFGWPNCELASNCGNPAYTAPIHSYAHDGRDAAVVSGFVYRGSQFPSTYVGNYFFADYTQNWIKRLTFDANGKVSGVFNFEPADGAADGPYGDIVYLAQGPDGALYYVDLGYSDIGGEFGVSKIRRIRFTGGNQAPIAVAAGNPTSGPSPLTVSFSSVGSSDPEGQPLTYSWTFGDGGTSSQANPQHTYAAAGQYTASVAVSDGVNTTVSPPLTIRVGGAPTATIQQPTEGLTFRAGDVISFSGEATDPDDGTLPDSAFTWNIDFLHATHVHPGTPITGTKSGSFTIASSGHDFSGNTRYRITLTVTDSNGLVDTDSVIVNPIKVNVTFDTVPSGLSITLDGIPRATPFVHDTLVGFTHAVVAPDQSSGGTSYTFGSWSDGGAQTHLLVVPETPHTYTATFQTAAGDTQPPTDPSNLAATTAGTAQINLSWNASSDNVGVAGYRLERCQGSTCTNFAEVGQPTGTTFADTGLTASTIYRYRVRAVDAATNLSGYSNVANAQTSTPATGLVGAYSFNEGSGTTVGDTSGLGNHGTQTGALWQAGRYGQALRFNSNGDWVTIPDTASLDLTTGMTIEAWVNPTGFGEWRTIILKQTATYFVYGLYGNPSGVGHAEVVVGGNLTQAVGGTALPLNTWTHLAATYGGGVLRLFRNGTQVATFNRTGAIGTSTGPLRIGGNSIWPVEFFNGLVDEVRIYNRALSSLEIQADMNAPIGGVTGASLAPSWLVDPLVNATRSEAR